jgi:thiol-disulfide isomerase/thioredoxin
MDYADPRFRKSGLFRDVFESQFWLLENSGGSLDSIYSKMEVSIAAILLSVEKDNTLYNEVAAYILELLERRSLTQAAEYLALTVLDQNQMGLQPRFASKLEGYRAMKVGVMVPDIQFAGDILLQGKPIAYPTSLAEVRTPYRLAIFGASWCPGCSEAMAELIPLYKKWNGLGLEAIFVSLDTDPKAFQAYSAGIPFIAYSDYKKWDTQAVLDYHVSSSPSFYLVDQSGKLLLRPQSVKQIDAWVDWKVGE